MGRKPASQKNQELINKAKDVCNIKIQGLDLSNLSDETVIVITLKPPVDIEVVNFIQEISKDYFGNCKVLCIQEGIKFDKKTISQIFREGESDSNE